MSNLDVLYGNVYKKICTYRYLVQINMNSKFFNAYERIKSFNTIPAEKHLRDLLLGKEWLQPLPRNRFDYTGSLPVPTVRNIVQYFVIAQYFFIGFSNKGYFLQN